MQAANPPIGPESRLLLVDGHSLAYRAFFALPVDNFAAPDGQPTNAIHGFCSMLLQVIESEAPTHLAVAFDVSRDTFRRAEFPDYKAQRAKSPVEFSTQVPLIKEVLGALRIVNLAVDGYEADDVIATLGVSAAEQGSEVLILTGDRDTLQLVSDRITVLYPNKGVRDLARLTPHAVFEKYGVRPDQYADFAALRGDPSDNLPSTPGVGEKTAAGWLAQYGNLDGIVANADLIKGKVGESLRGNLSQVLMNRRLTQLVTDTPVGVEVHELDLRGADVGELTRVFDRLGFKAMRSRALKVMGQSGAAAPTAPTAEQPRPAEIGWTPGQLGAILADFPAQEAVAVAAVEQAAELTGLAFAWSGGTLVVDLLAATDRDHAALRAAFGDPQREFAAHTVRPLAHWAGRQGFEPQAIKYDTELLEYLINPGLRGLDLATTVQRRLMRDLDQAESDTLFAQPLSGLAQSAEAVRELLPVLLREADESVLRLHRELELPLAKLLARMEVVGIAVDRAELAGLDAEFGQQMSAAEAAAHAAAGRAFNLGSPKQLQELLFTERKLPTTKKIKTGYTTDAESLQWLFENTGDPVVEQILRWREVSKLRQTVAGLLPLLDANSRVHTTFQQTVAATGRLSSADPNLQNIPVRTEAGRRIRACFVPGGEFSALMTADYSQIEMRIMAHLSQDEGLIAAFHSGEDLHTTVACEVFGVEPAGVTPDMRRRIKAMSYGLAYGLSAFGLSQQLGIQPAEATALMERYFERFGGVQRYLREVVVAATRDGFTETMFGRRRYLPELSSSRNDLRAAAERMALNSPIQGSAADIIKRAMLLVDEQLRQAGLASRLVLQVHDELVLEVAQGEAAAAEAILRSGMAAAAELAVPLDVSVGLGPNWDAAAH